MCVYFITAFAVVHMEIQAFIGHKKTDGISMCTTAKAVIKLLFWVYVKRRGFFLVKRAAGDEACASFF